jgi:hypothetical protein
MRQGADHAAYRVMPTIEAIHVALAAAASLQTDDRAGTERPRRGDPSQGRLDGNGGALGCWRGRRLRLLRAQQCGNFRCRQP